MSWKKLQAEGKVRAHEASKKELDELRAVIARDLEDAAIQELSDDRRFATAYNAALQSAKMAIVCAGYQPASTPGHHRLTFEAARLALGASAADHLDFFEACRRKRNVIDYDHAPSQLIQRPKRLWRKRRISSSWSALDCFKSS
jgi:hypothetical protein